MARPESRTGAFLYSPAVAPGAVKTTLLFLHIPKTAGATLTGVLGTRFAERDCQELYVKPAPDLSNLDGFRYVTGHVDIRFLDEFEGNPFVITFLRDPIDRSLSSYSYLRSLDETFTRSLLFPGRGPGALDRLLRCMRLTHECSIDELIAREPAIAAEYFGSRQSRVLGGTDPRGGDERLDLALEGLERCDFVGITERIDESASWLARRLGWRDLAPLPRTNVSSARVSRGELSPQALEALTELTQVDHDLYREAVGRYERRLAEWTRLKDPRDAAARIPDATPMTDLHFGDAIPGGGWVARERVDGGESFSWLGDTRRAWVELVPAADADRLVVEIPHVLDQRILEGLRISLDGKLVEHSLRPADGVIVASAPLPRSRFRRRRRPYRVTIEVADTIRPCDVDPDSVDRRELSIAVRRIGLVGASGRS